MTFLSSAIMRKALLIAPLRCSYLPQPLLLKSRQLCSDTSSPRNPMVDKHSASQQPEKGAIYDKKPFKVVCEAGKKYSWCTCGKSKSQPFCDGTHKNVFLKIKFRPVRFTVEQTKEYYLCNCKQTDNRPFCDGSHKKDNVKNASTKT